jgi:23S rRNA pseudouridine1911/1915/1917 synthase
MDLKILYEDKYIISLLKPPGMLSQSDSEEDIGALIDCPTHIINRLDRPVGGIVLLAKDTDTAASLTALMRDGGISKHYLAVVCGKCEVQADFTDYLMINRRLNLSKIVNKGMRDAKQARLSYRLIAEGEDSSLIDVTLYTGRHHQIRAQLAHHSLPIWGDTKYNPDFKHKRGVLPALFAHSLTFTHPVTGELLEIRALPDYGKFTDFTEALK